MQPSIYADLRCLQDPAYQHRGIGYHTAALLRARKRSPLSHCKTIGLVDARMPRLPAEFILLVDEVSSSANLCCDGVPAVYIDGSPMTHDPRFSLRLQSHPAFLRAAVLYDFIPLDWPGYLPTVAKRIEYLAKLARLRDFDLFFPISEYTAWRLSELLGVSCTRVNVTGASVRRSLYEHRDRLPFPFSPYARNELYFVTLGGDDKRKNTELAVKAVRHLNLVYGHRIGLKVLGHYGGGYKRDLLHLAGHIEGDGFLEFHPNVPDEELVLLHAGAIAAIAPSYIEGFSLPIPEASVCGCPVVASTCAAHMELVEQMEALFPPDDSATLSEQLDALLEEPARRTSLVALQAHLGSKFHEDEVGKRFWSAIAVALENRANPVVVAKPQKPWLAFLSPYPPDQSDAASYTAMMMEAGKQLFHSDVYTDADRPLTFENRFQDAGAVSLAPLLNRRYNAVISVLGNSRCHTRIFEVFERYGGPCILHDARLTQFYFHRFGQEKFINFAARLLGRSVSKDEVTIWLQDQNPPSLFLEDVIERASPLIVNTVTQQALIKRRYGAHAYVTTCCPSTFFNDEELTGSAKERARERYDIAQTAFLISTFGPVCRAKGMETCILAVELLRSWNIPAELYFIGDVGSQQRELARISTLYGISEHIHSGAEFADYAAYRDFLVASDASVQLRNYDFGQLSTALIDSISAGLPAVATSDLAESCDAPTFLSVVPDRFSTLLVAEQLALLWESHTERAAHADARAAYLQTHNFDYYGKRLIEILGIV